MRDSDKIDLDAIDLFRKGGGPVIDLNGDGRGYGVFLDGHGYGYDGGFGFGDGDGSGYGGGYGDGYGDGVDAAGESLPPPCIAEVGE